MKMTIVSVHPARTVVASGDQQFEIPTAWFSTRPKPGQTWEISLKQKLNDDERREQLNHYLKRT